MKCFQNVFLQILWKHCNSDSLIVLPALTDSGNLCCLLTTIANSLDPDQVAQNVGPDLDPNMFDYPKNVPEIIFDKVYF